MADVIVYVDGFNLYYGSLKRTPYKWLDLGRLCAGMLPNDQVIAIKYYTARISARPGNPSAPNDQQILSADTDAEPQRFWMILPGQRLRPQLVRVEEPQGLRCYAMLYGFTAILLPRTGDVNFHARLAARPDTFTEKLSGTEFPWPAGPMCHWDFQ